MDCSKNSSRQTQNNNNENPLNSVCALSHKATAGDFCLWEYKYSSMLQSLSGSCSDYHPNTEQGGPSLKSFQCEYTRLGGKSPGSRGKPQQQQDSMPATLRWIVEAAELQLWMPLMLSELLPPSSRQVALPISASLAKSNPAHLPQPSRDFFPPFNSPSCGIGAV